MDNAITEAKTCQHCQSSFDITQSDLDFYNKISPSFAGKKFDIPTPTLCPDCRQRRRLSFRNERKLYRRQCDASQKSIISIYSPDKPYTVYDQSIWWSDSRDPMDYGCEFDFTRTFGENFRELLIRVPKLGLIITDDVENSNYTNFTGASKNVYLSSDILDGEDVFYSSNIKNVINCYDGLDIVESQELYECAHSSQLYGCKYVIFSKGCTNSIYLYHCVGVSDSAYCVGIKNKKHHILNRKYSLEEYEDIMKNSNHNSLFWEYQKLIEKHKPIKRVINSEDVSGNHLENCSRVYDSYFLQNGSNSKYLYLGYNMDQCMDTTIHNPDCYLDYEAISGGKLKNSGFNILGRGGNHMYYSRLCIDSSNLFGCIGLRNKQYCIFNKQYSKEEYEIQVAKIIQHMITTGERGEFFHPSLSPFGYNETVAQEYYPVTLTDDGQMIDQRIDSEDVKSSDRSSEISSANLQIQGYKRSSYEAPTPQVDKVIKGQDLPDTITDVTDDILKVAIQCEVSNKLFRIIPQELIFYRKHNISLPRKHPDVRHLERMALRR